MAVVKRARTRDVEPYNPGEASSIFVVPPVDEWLEARPPVTGKVSRAWATIITPSRVMARSWLWVTYTWLRFVIVTSVFSAVVIIVYLQLTK